jgi:O-antigen/teichoic acid export membrane protein
VDGFYAIYAILGALLVLVSATRLTTPGIRREDRHPLHLRKALRLPPEIWRFGAWLLPLAFLAPYAGWFVKYDTLKLYGVDAAGILQGAIGISLSVRALLGAAHPVFLTPNVNRQEDPRSRMLWADEFQRATGLLFALALPPLLLFSDVALRVLYAPAFLSGSAFVALFVAAEVITMLSGTYQALIIAGDSMAFHVAQNLTAQLLLAGTAFVALPRIGLAGAGLAALSAPVFLFASTLLFLRRKHGIQPSTAAARAPLLAIGILLVAGTVGSAYPGLSLGLLSAKAALCAAIWVASLAVIPAEDRARLRRGLALVADRRAAMRAAARDRVA